MTLRGTRVFVVEDEALLLLTLEDMLGELGCEVVAGKGTFDDLAEQARALSFDIAVLDVNVHGQRIDPVADVLAERSIPFVFATGYSQSGLPPAYQDRPAISKPYQAEQLREALLKTLGDRRAA